MKTNKTNFLISTGLMLSLALAFLVSVPSADAYVQNITVAGDMTVGSTGTNVAVLQSLMSELGYLSVPIGVPFGYFGSLTQSAVARYQAAQGVSPTAGYFGPITKVSMHNQFAAHNWLVLLGW
jgi:peptidoglycan hydrolase-like protein with peptidoglycan-binding domain